MLTISVSRPIQSIVRHIGGAEYNIENGHQCPECGSMETEDNAATEYRCYQCDHRWGQEYGEKYGY